MRIGIHTLGTRGDIQPYVALALGLTRRGHDVQIAAPAPFEPLIAGHGLRFAPLPGEFLALMDMPEGKAAIAGGQGFGGGLKLLKHVRPLMRRLMDEEWAAARAFAPDVILRHPKSIATPHIASALRCRHLLASPLPGFTPTAAFPSPMLPVASLGPFNRASHALVLKGVDLLFAGAVRAWREDVLGLSGPVAPSSGTLYAYSAHVVPVPADWGADVLVSGYWFLDSPGWRPPEDLAAFLEAGDPPIYVGFGSMPGLDPTRLTGIIVDALARSGKRGLLASGGGALTAGNLPPHVMIIKEAPHDRLLPLVAATIHHGGAGTTAAALRAGRPSAICPFFGDQPFWARRVVGLGAGPPPLDLKTLTADRLATAIMAMDDPAMRDRAGTLGTLIRAEDGIRASIDFIERTARH